MNPSERAELLSVIERFRRQHLVMLGDLVADEFVYGEIARASREAPVLILKERERQIVPGGGANAVNNLADLGARVTPVGVVGEDASGDALLAYFKHKGISIGRIARASDYSTPTKSRVLGGVTHWQRQQIVRVDREPRKPPTPSLRRRLTQRAVSAMHTASAVVLSDYGYGATDAREAKLLRRAAPQRGLPITVDSRFALSAYTHLTAATPNEPELEEVFRKRIGTNLGLLHRLGQRFLQQQRLQALLVTRGREGVVLFEPGRSPRHIPVFGSDQAVDVTGAGDTVIAAFTLALAAGASFFQAAQIANCAGGLVVMKRGTATVTTGELQEAIRNS